MKIENNKNIIVLSDFENFKKNIDRIFTPLSLESINYSFINSVDEIKDSIINKKGDLLVINKSSYTENEIDYLLSLETSIEIIVIIDSYFKFDVLFKKFEHGIITLRRPVTVNKFIEVSKVCLLSIDKRRKNPLENEHDTRIVDFAKVLLIIYEKYTEDEAHKYLEKYAMELRIQFIKAAKNIISYYMKEMENIKYEC